MVFIHRPQVDGAQHNGDGDHGDGDDRRSSTSDFFDSRALRILTPAVLLAMSVFGTMVWQHSRDSDAKIDKAINDATELRAVVASHDRIFREVDDIQKNQIDVL